MDKLKKRIQKIDMSFLKILKHGKIIRNMKKTISTRGFLNMIKT